jgi:Flp pilus assembly protein TadB
MAQRRKRSGPQRPVPGFRPGKEPPQLRKRKAMEQYGDVGWAQERLIAAFAERSPAESRRLIRRWTLALLAVGIVLAVIGALLYLWSLIAGAVVHVVAAVVLVLWWRVHRQREGLETMADAVGGRAGGRRRGKG